MAAQPVEWVLVIYYGPSAHRATYGRLDGQDTKYTKDYIQLSKKTEFLETLAGLFPGGNSGAGTVPLTYRWPTGTTPGTLVFNSADRPHLKWETSLGAPKAWKLLSAPSEASAETIPGDPSHLDFAAAEKELALLGSRGAGQPYLLAIKLRDEPRTLHLRAYLDSPSAQYAWADLNLVPQGVRYLAAKTSQRSALGWSTFQSGGTVAGAKVEDVLAQLIGSADPTTLIGTCDSEVSQALASYLRHPGYGLFFDPARNHDAWFQPAPLPERIATSVDVLLNALEKSSKTTAQPDAVAETVEADPDEVDDFRRQIDRRSYEVADSTATVKTRGSAQRAFAEVVKVNYGYRCAITGISTKDFLVAAHIVPWSEDQSIRLDPSNGLCLSLLVDRAFESGYLLIEDDLTIRIDRRKIGSDHRLLRFLEPYDGQTLSVPTTGAPRPEYLRRRRVIVAPAD